MRWPGIALDSFWICLDLDFLWDVAALWALRLFSCIHSQGCALGYGVMPRWGAFRHLQSSQAVIRQPQRGETRQPRAQALVVLLRPGGAH